MLKRLERKHLLIGGRIVALLVLIMAFAACYALGESSLVFLKKLFTARNSYDAMRSQSGIDISTLACCGIRLLYYFAVGVVSVCIMMLTPRRKIWALTRTGIHSLQVYFLHPFVYYGLNKLAYATTLYEVLPKSMATLLLFSTGILLALALGTPNFPQRIFDKLKGSLGRFTVRDDG